MKALLFTTLLISQSATAMETTDMEIAARNEWICLAQGKQSFGGPVGDIWQTVRGHGSTQQEAVTSAQQNCLSRGLQSCIVTDCYKK